MLETKSIEIPKNLYIPPDALQVFLESFEGPLDLLLYLIKKQNIDICDIPIAEITEQYMSYIHLMEQINWNLASEYLVMAAMLAEIKSKLLLPKPPSLDEEEEDPRAELIHRLQEYERFKKAANDIDQLPRANRDVFAVSISKPLEIVEKKYVEIALEDLTLSLIALMKRTQKKAAHPVQMETLTLKDKVLFLTQKLASKRWFKFHELLNKKESIEGVVVTFMAVLELLRQEKVEIEYIGNVFECRMIAEEG